MKISKLEDVDLSQYRIAYAATNIMQDEYHSHDEIMALAEIGKTTEMVTIALIPKDKRLVDCGGDDWNDVPASCNAGGFYHYPLGTIFLQGMLGEELRISEREEI